MPDVQSSIPSSSLEFLELLKENNQRDWFNANKDLFLEQQSYIENFAETLLGKLNRHDVIETVSGKKSLQRIYRDTRFSKDKTPYKTNWSGGFSRASAQRRGGYYFHIEPGNSFVAGGFWAPNAQDIRLIRDDIAFDDSPLRNILSAPSFVSSFGELRGEQLKTTPKGFDSDHNAIDLLRFKQFLLMKRFSDEQVISGSFTDEADITYQNMRPLFDYMSEILTGDLNGIVD